jgi:hypothetical protein
MRYNRNLRRVAPRRALPAASLLGGFGSLLGRVGRRVHNQLIYRWFLTAPRSVLAPNRLFSLLFRFCREEPVGRAGRATAGVLALANQNPDTVGMGPSRPKPLTERWRTRSPAHAPPVLIPDPRWLLSVLHYNLRCAQDRGRSNSERGDETRRRRSARCADGSRENPQDANCSRREAARDLLCQRQGFSPFPRGPRWPLRGFARRRGLAAAFGQWAR